MPVVLQPVCLTIAGLDPSGAAGILADVKSFSRLGCFGMAVATSVTFQNSTGVSGAVHQGAESILQQAAPLFEDFDIAAMKTGMLPDASAVKAVARLIRENEVKSLVVDPVTHSTSGFQLIDRDAVWGLRELIFPLAAVVTPNIPESETLTGMRIFDNETICRAGRILLEMGPRAVVIKGGHSYDRAARSVNSHSSKGRTSSAAELQATDYLFIGSDVVCFSTEFLEVKARGTGCAFSAAIAAGLGRGLSDRESVGLAKSFITRAIQTVPPIGRGRSPLNFLSHPQGSTDTDTSLNIISGVTISSE
jgi:hydroxymethylpyrimidine/phosphomethylpyrimidine kinase